MVIIKEIKIDKKTKEIEELKEIMMQQKKKMRRYTAYAMLVLFAAVFIGFYGNYTGMFISTETVESLDMEYDIDSFASCLTERGAVMYGSEGCGFCKKQKDLFGDSFERIDYVECSKAGDACRSAGITGFPTWIINSVDFLVGFQELEELASATGCPLE